MNSTISPATQAAPNKPLRLIGLRRSPEIASYDSVPWYRKQWFALFPLCAPLLVVIALTGSVYTKANTSMQQYSDANVWHFTLPTRLAMAALAVLTTVMVTHPLWS